MQITLTGEHLVEQGVEVAFDSEAIIDRKKSLTTDTRVIFLRDNKQILLTDLGYKYINTLLIGA